GTRIDVDGIQNALNDACNWNLPLSMHLDQLKTTERLGALEKRLQGMDLTSAGLSEKLQRCENVLHGLYHDRQHFLETAEVDCPQC
ncbi:hypothetical protein, partial [Salmonella enterica]|uniref:hypothetical protein n=1 Tax=Salmonella enterica TaxID=28901 RepID=UPI003EDB90CB